MFKDMLFFTVSMSATLIISYLLDPEFMEFSGKFTVYFFSNLIN